MTVLISQKQFYSFWKTVVMTLYRQWQQLKVTNDKRSIQVLFVARSAELVWTIFAVCTQLERAVSALLPFW